jgi:hypothetical protein
MHAHIPAQFSYHRPTLQLDLDPVLPQPQSLESEYRMSITVPTGLSRKAHLEHDFQIKRQGASGCYTLVIQIILQPQGKLMATHRFELTSVDIQQIHEQAVL